MSAAEPAMGPVPPAHAAYGATAIPSARSLSSPLHRRGPWSADEDSTLLELVGGSGSQVNWVHIATSLGTRTAKQCRERYHQNLKPSLNLNPITPEEGVQIEELVNEIGHRWAEIARRLNNRSDNAVKNYWNGGKGRRKRLPRAGPIPAASVGRHDRNQQREAPCPARAVSFRPFPEQLMLPIPRAQDPLSPTTTYAPPHMSTANSYYGESPLPSPTGPPPSLYSDSSAAASYESSPSTTLTTPRTPVSFSSARPIHVLGAPVVPGAPFADLRRLPEPPAKPTPATYPRLASLPDPELTLAPIHHHIPTLQRPNICRREEAPYSTTTSRMVTAAPVLSRPSSSHSSGSASSGRSSNSQGFLNKVLN